MCWIRVYLGLDLMDHNYNEGMKNSNQGYSQSGYPFLAISKVSLGVWSGKPAIGRIPTDPTKG